MRTHFKTNYWQDQPKTLPYGTTTILRMDGEHNTPNSAPIPGEDRAIA